jgi:peptide/nickel transport system permease protein
MSSYVLRRLLALIPTLFFASVIVFVTVRLIPGDIIDLMLSERDISSAQLSRDQLLQALGLDRPLWDQYLRWVSGILFHADLGKSLWQGVPVSEQLAERLPVSFELGLIAMIIGLTGKTPRPTTSRARFRF